MKFMTFWPLALTHYIMLSSNPPWLFFCFFWKWHIIILALWFKFTTVQEYFPTTGTNLMLELQRRRILCRFLNQVSIAVVSPLRYMRRSAAHLSTADVTQQKGQSFDTWLVSQLCFSWLCRGSAAGTVFWHLSIVIKRLGPCTLQTVSWAHGDAVIKVAQVKSYRLEK